MNVARSVINLFTGENKATLSGGIDIIAVENEDGNILTTPFHVRFGRLSGVLNPKEKVVSITVNGKKTNAKMKLGPAGEAFFVEETRVSLERDFCTSPLISPLPSPELRGREVNAVMEMLSLDSDGEDDGITNNNDVNSLAVDTKLTTTTTTETDEKYWEKYALLSPDHRAIQKRSSSDRTGMNDNNNVTKQTRRPSASPPALNLEEDTEENMDKSITNDAKEGSNKSRSWSWHWGWGEVNPHRRKTPHGKGLEKLEMTALDVLNAEEKDGKANATKDSNNEDDDDDEQFNTARQLLRPTSTKKEKTNDNNNSVKNITSNESGKETTTIDILQKNSINNNDDDDNDTSDITTDNNQNDISFIKSVKISMCANLISKNVDETYIFNDENLEVFYQKQNLINQNDFKPGMLDNEKLLFLVNNSEFYKWSQLSPLVLNMEDGDVISDDNTKTKIVNGNSNNVNNSNNNNNNNNNDDDDDDSNSGGGFFAWLRGSGKKIVSKVDNNKNQNITSTNRNGQNNNMDNNIMDDDDDDNNNNNNNYILPGLTRSPSSSMDDTFLSISIDGDNPEGLPPARSISPALSDELNLSQDAKMHLDKGKSYDGVYYRKTLRPPSTKTLSTWGLKKDMNDIEFSVTTTSGQVVIVKSRIFLWPSDSKIVISDVDGTITKSDLLGHIMPRFGVNYSHEGVVSLYSTIEKHGYKLMYLSSRPIGQSNQTKDYLGGLEENDLKLPHGPVVLSPDRLFQSLAREVIYKRPQEFKVPALRDIRNLFPKNRPSPFYAGFGNRDSDKIAYRSVGVTPGKIFIVNPSGVIVTENLKMEHSYSSIHELKHHVFPDISVQKKERLSTHTSFNDTNFWKRSIVNISDDEDDEEEEERINEERQQEEQQQAKKQKEEEEQQQQQQQQMDDDQMVEDQILANMMATIM